MPLAFTNYNPNTKPNMEPYTSVTREEFNNMIKWHRQTEYTNDELMALVNMNRKYVNPRTPTCLSCRGNLRETKNQLMSFYLEHKEQIELNLAEKENPAPTPKKNVKTK